ncbi:UDP-N-acetylmuramate dehydrogenase [Entomospira culicis]|uniref:UDP-N-acetylenolpyruvoylglucosamine reductase n=1 Tax=Entomospira culicis TaxID=2719989 RepID=A0A968GJS4_9SPIO|nr:UDP-N-acetylmuramate dehydrogenase [Entomospira culicis]NIZ19761.1 UDP-N-acetylmuramate dehydrogenase [Entomospira culicis]NIZ69975.1 UDP-N-acetylmuramate dehydrogenase [Entomospira culicis]WDI37080.1 UDP-N-acetylmuramate dehydrogenase [Entomospira culicis]WDI38709.1 UDP-N-acetylmuramate dehydrogenase [Entomospira culicis]
MSLRTHRQAIIEQARITSQEYTLQAPLKERTWFKVGGKADLLIHTQEHTKIARVMALAHQYAVPLFFLGDGSNLVISDEGIEGIVIDTQALSAHQTPTRLTNDRIKAPAGILMEQLVLWSVEQQLEGLTPFYGLPGTLGGALFMNARCYDAEMADILVDITILNERGEREVIPFKPEQWEYKVSPLQHRLALVIEATLSLKASTQSIEALRQHAQSFKDDRTQKGHFAYPCGGSTFKNNRAFGKPSGQIIDGCSLKGYAIGGASVSQFHANIVINQNNAKASEIYQLVAHIKDEVLRQTGHMLEPEVLFVGRNFPLL